MESRDGVDAYLFLKSKEFNYYLLERRGFEISVGLIGV